MSPEPRRPLRSVFFLAADLGATGVARQLTLLAGGLPRDRFRVEVGVLGPADTPAADGLRSAGITVHALPVRHAIDVRGMRTLRQVVAAAAPTVVHAWGPSAVRLSRLVAHRADGENAPRVVVSASASPGGGLSGWLTTFRLRRADRVVSATWAEAERYRRLGVAGERLTRISPAATTCCATDRGAFLRAIGLPPTARVIVAAGRLEANSGLKAAIWAFDMLRYDFPDLYLLVFGTGPERAGLEAFGRAVAFDDFRVRFPGSRPDLPAVLGFAEAVWVTHERGGVNLALEAMAAGRPVIGWKTPDLVEVIENGVSGHLVILGDRPQVAAKTYAILADPTLGAALGAAARARTAERFTVGRMIEQYARLYEELAAPGGKEWGSPARVV